MDSTPKYHLHERVQVVGWVGSNIGVIEDIKQIYHHRLQKETWGYRVKFDDNKPVLSMAYAPEGYLRKLGSDGKPTLEDKI